MRVCNIQQKMSRHAGHAALRQLHPRTTKCQEEKELFRFQILFSRAAFVAYEPDFSVLSGLLSITTALSISRLEGVMVHDHHA
jgi:hypothetical protein